MNNQYIAQLQELNLSPNEAKVYIALLEIGQTSAGQIIKKTGLHRSVVYETFEKLLQRKLIVKVTKRNIAYFQATDPARLLESAKSQLELAETLIPRLRQLVDTKIPEITVYEGVEAYRRFWVESAKRMKPNSIDYVAGSIGGDWMKLLGKDAADQYIRNCVARGISWKMIVFDIDDLEQSFLAHYPNFRAECRVIDREVTKEGNFNIFGTEKVILHSATEPMIIEVKNQSLVRVFQNLFDILWEQGKSMPTPQEN